MPNHEEHCQHSLKRVGIRGDEIHTWIDEPSKIAGSSHRQFRHGLEAIDTAIQVFGSQYGVEKVREIFLDHLMADSEDNSEKTEMRIQVESEKIAEKEAILRLYKNHWRNNVIFFTLFLSTILIIFPILPFIIICGILSLILIFPCWANMKDADEKLKQLHA